jgi:hypothetical protein
MQALRIASGADYLGCLRDEPDELDHLVSALLIGVTASPPIRTAGSGITQLAERALLSRVVPPSVLVREGGQILHVHGRTGRFLEPAPGSPADANLFDMARDGLRLPLADAMSRAAVSGEAVNRDVRVVAGRSSVRFDLRVLRLSSPEPLRGVYVVSFERAEEIPERMLTVAGAVHERALARLHASNHEIETTHRSARIANEALLGANEELESSRRRCQRCPY